MLPFHYYNYEHDITDQFYLFTIIVLAGKHVYVLPKEISICISFKV